MRLGRTVVFVAVVLSAVLAGARTADAFVVTFDGLLADTTIFHNGDTFSNGGASMTAVDLSAGGSAKVVSSNKANGGGNEMLLSGEALTFSPLPRNGVSFQYYLDLSNPNASVTMQVNGLTPVTASNFTNQTLGSVQMFATSSLVNNDTGILGSVFLVGPITSLEFGGTGLYVDNIIGCTPEPATLSLLALGGILVRARRK